MEEKITIESMQHAASFWADLDRLLMALEKPDNEQQKAQYYRIRKVVDKEIGIINRKYDEI